MLYKRQAQLVTRMLILRIKPKVKAKLNPPEAKPLGTDFTKTFEAIWLARGLCNTLMNQRFVQYTWGMVGLFFTSFDNL